MRISQCEITESKKTKNRRCKFHNVKLRNVWQNIRSRNRYKGKILAFSFRLLLRKIHLPPGWRQGFRKTSLRLRVAPYRIIHHSSFIIHHSSFITPMADSIQSYQIGDFQEYARGMGRKGVLKNLSLISAPSVLCLMIFISISTSSSVCA